MNKIPFNKQVLSIDDQINLLVKRKMLIPDRARAEHYLRFIGYYRLSGYWVPFQHRDGTAAHDQFRPNTTFQDVLDLYVFDRRLRILIMDAIERIEVAARSVISNTMAESRGSHWFLDPLAFVSSVDQKNFLDKAKRDSGIDPEDKRKQTESIKHYINKYSIPVEPPCWMIFEALSFGTISRLYKFNISDSDKKRVASQFDIPRGKLGSWLHSAAHLRNLCAHHSRVWNRTFGVVPSIVSAEKYHISQPNKFYNHAVMIQILLKKISGDTHWSIRLKGLLDEYPQVHIDRMGFPVNWCGQPVWR